MSLWFRSKQITFRLSHQCLHDLPFLQKQLWNWSWDITILLLLLLLKRLPLSFGRKNGRIKSDAINRVDVFHTVIIFSKSPSWCWVNKHTILHELRCMSCWHELYCFCFFFHIKWKSSAAANSVSPHDLDWQNLNCM